MSSRGAARASDPARSGTAARSIEEVRARFPALASGTAFLENAGGSQVPQTVVGRVRDYFRESYVQLGAGYALSRRADEVVDDAHGFVETLLGAEDDPVALGPSSSVMLRLLADAFGEVMKPGAAIVVAESGHEANIGPWLRLERRGARILWWRMDPRTGGQPLDDLERLLRSGPTVLALPHVSNLLGEVHDLARITSLAHEAGARVVADGVAFAPHRMPRVREWDVDFYAVSLYKVFGPHVAALYGKRSAFAELPGPNHFFISHEDLPYKFELGGVSHEACAGLLGVRDYLEWLSGMETPRNGEAAGSGETVASDRRALERATISRAFARIEELERPLQRRLIEELAAREGVRIIGPLATDSSRVPTVSFVREGVPSARIAAAAHARDVAVRHGSMYAWRLCEALGLDPRDGVVRASLVHYNAEHEIERLLAALDD